MRAILLTDLDICARALLLAVPERRADLVAALLSGADLADRYRRRTGRRHPDLGDGSLGSAARRHPLADRPPRCCSEYCACLALVLGGLADWRRRSGRCNGWPVAGL